MRLSSITLAVLLVPFGIPAVASSSSGEDLLPQKMSEASDLASRSRERAEAQKRRDHDLRLKERYRDLAIRSCDAPGSVSQEELDALPAPYDADFAAEPPEDAGACVRAVCKALQDRVLADYIELVAKPREILPVRPSEPAPAVVIAGSTFASILPGLKTYAELACKYDGNIPRVGELFVPRVPYFLSARDQAAVSSLAAGLGPCEARLFRRLAEDVRAERGDKINAQWLADEIAASKAPAKADAAGVKPVAAVGPASVPNAL